ncbi:MAG: ShlB/FhaC/HecB family hemolysin secretion/activation protein [Gammaproteobacteria bacterium]
MGKIAVSFFVLFFIWNSVEANQDLGDCFPISKIYLTGEGANRFRFALNPILNEMKFSNVYCLGSDDINKILHRVQNAIIEEGYVTTRVVLPPQDLKSGVLDLRVVPGRIGTIQVQSPFDPCKTMQNTLPLRAGDFLNLRHVEQSLEQFKRIPTVQANIEIEPVHSKDAKGSESNVVIHHHQRFPLRLDVSVDDAGSKATGRYQSGLIIYYDNPLALNDLFYISFNHDLSSHQQGSEGYALQYSVPYGYWLTSLKSERYDYYQSIAGSSHPYVYSGTSQNSDFKLSRLIYRDGERKTTLSLRTYLKTSNNFVNDSSVEVQRRRMAGWEVGLSHRELIANNTIDLGINYRHGMGSFGAISGPEAATGEATPHPIVITAHALAHAPFKLGHQNLHYRGSWRSQWHQTSLIQQDKFAIGGRYTVRGFDGQNMLASERGWILRNDMALAWRYPYPELYLGIDYGIVAGPTADLLMGKELVGSVLGLRGDLKGFYYDAFIGKPFHKPKDFETAGITAGFQVGWRSD